MKIGDMMKLEALSLLVEGNATSSLMVGMA